MPLDDSKHYNGGGGGGDDWHSQHHDLEMFTHALMEASAASILLNNKCIGCTTYMMSAVGFGRWLATKVMTDVKDGDLPKLHCDETKEFIASELADMVEAVMHEYTDALKALMDE